MNEYRCTRVLPYIDHNCYGKDDRMARQSYYVESIDVNGAFKKMASEFPEDVIECKRRDINPFTINLHTSYHICDNDLEAEVMAP